MSFDFPNAQLPELLPLKNSVAQGNFEAENQLRNLFIALFGELLAVVVFDANVLGMPHLGSLDLVRKSVNADGLVLLQGDTEETAARYIYRAWNARNNQMRGLHFLRTYLQVLFPNAATVNQLAQAKAFPYPTKLIPLESANSDYYSTSRIAISVEYDKVTHQELATMQPVLRAVIPARLTLDFSLLANQNNKTCVACVVVVSRTVDIQPYAGTANEQTDNYLSASVYAQRTINVPAFI